MSTANNMIVIKYNKKDSKFEYLYLALFVVKYQNKTDDRLVAHTKEVRSSHDVSSNIITSVRMLDFYLNRLVIGIRTIFKTVYFIIISF